MGTAAAAGKIAYTYAERPLVKDIGTDIMPKDKQGNTFIEDTLTKCQQACSDKVKCTSFSWKKTADWAKKDDKAKKGEKSKCWLKTNTDAHIAQTAANNADPQLLADYVTFRKMAPCDTFDTCSATPATPVNK